MSTCVLCGRPDAWAQDLCPRCENDQRMEQERQAYEERVAQEYQLELEREAMLAARGFPEPDQPF